MSDAPTIVFFTVLGFLAGAIATVVVVDPGSTHACAPLVCEARTPPGRYLSGVCYEAAGLREVKP